MGLNCIGVNLKSYKMQGKHFYRFESRTVSISLSKNLNAAQEF